MRAGLIALDLTSLPEKKDKPDKVMTAKATALLQKGRDLPEGGTLERNRGPSGSCASSIKRSIQAVLPTTSKAKIRMVPEEVRPEMMLLAANSRDSSATPKMPRIFTGASFKISEPGRGERRSLPAHDRALQHE